MRRNLPELRKRIGNWSQVELSEAMRKLGHPMHPTSIAKIEKGTRQVTVDDLVALAAVLDVSPLRLLMPPTRDPDDEGLLVTHGAPPVRADVAWAWAEQRRSWSDEHDDTQDKGRQQRRNIADALRLDAYSADQDEEGAADGVGSWEAVLDELDMLRRSDYGLVVEELRLLRREVRREREWRHEERLAEVGWAAGAQPVGATGEQA